jgi:hypothetical protein
VHLLQLAGALVIGTLFGIVIGVLAAQDRQRKQARMDAQDENQKEGANEVKTRTRILWLAVALVAGFSALARPAQALSALALREDGGTIVVVVNGPSLAALSFSGASPLGNFAVTIFGSHEVDSAGLSVMSSSATTVTLTTGGTHTLELFTSSQDFTLPAERFVTVTSGAGGTYITGLGAVQFQAFADEGNAIAGIAGFSNGLQSAIPPAGSAATFHTGEASSVWDKGDAAAFSLTTGTAITLTGAAASANFSSHEILAPAAIPEPASLLLLGSGLLAAGVVLRRRGRA